MSAHHFILQCFDTMYISCKIVSEMPYYVSSGTRNLILTHSIIASPSCTFSAEFEVRVMYRIDSERMLACFS